MKYLVDTCVISEFTKKTPSKNVCTWFKSVNEEDVYLSVLTFGEIRKGISKLSEGSEKKAALFDWVANLEKRFTGRILEIDLDVAESWGHIQGELAKINKEMPVIDALIASIGITHSMVVVTRNINDMKRSGVELLNPFLL